MKPAKYTLDNELIYLAKLRKMSGEQRFRIGAGLYDLAIKIAKAGIISQNPGISERELKKELLRRIYPDESYRHFIDSI